MSDPTQDADGLQRRTLLKGTAAILASGIAPAIHAQEKVVLRYLEHSPVVIHGSSTGRRYEFSAASPKQRVDARDAESLLATPFFRRVNA